MALHDHLSPHFLFSITIKTDADSLCDVMLWCQGSRIVFNIINVSNVQIFIVFIFAYRALIRNIQQYQCFLKREEVTT